MEMLSERCWNTVRAALIFWRETMKSSRVHPMEHRAVRYLFGGENPTPLTTEEINGVLALELVRPRCTIKQAIQGTKIDHKIVRQWLWRHDRKRVGKIGPCSLFYVDDLNDAITEITKKYEQKTTHNDPAA